MPRHLEVLRAHWKREDEERVREFKHLFDEAMNLKNIRRAYDGSYEVWIKNRKAIFKFYLHMDSFLHFVIRCEEGLTWEGTYEALPENIKEFIIWNMDLFT
nr:hypothetical protein 70 [bacterium]